MTNIPNTIPIHVYWAEGEKGEVIFDREEMVRELESCIDDMEQDIKGGGEK